MRKTNLFGATFLALATSAWSLGAVAQAPTPAPAPSAAPAPAPAPAPEAAPAPDAAPAPATPDAAAPAKPAKKHVMHKKAMKGEGKLAPTKAGDKAVEDLNDASLAAAKDNKPFVAPTTPDAAKKEAHVPMHKKMAMKHKMKKTDAAAPAPDAAAPAPADAPK